MQPQPGLTPLMCASREGRANVVALLLRARASMDARDEDGMQALHLACSGGHFECCRQLLKAGARASEPDLDGRDAYACLPTDCVANDHARAWETLLRSVQSEDGLSLKDRCGIFGGKLVAPAA
eukprot:TRINITY_DN4241_c0_g1_i1.p4 TRINITY_DN4241_c0_g1~~TRINITY_DN4241_c0_g1_i1.p4  ORF type:complete len:124 (-),score=20.13 TRINITY_DN4241_c0_g1_i1:69-440(-)